MVSPFHPAGMRCPNHPHRSRSIAAARDTSGVAAGGRCVGYGRMELECIGRAELDAERLMREHPPRFSNERKRAVVDRITVPVTGTLSVSRWQGALPATVESAGDPDTVLVERHFDHVADEPGVVHWYLNFADAELFVAYAGSLLAQDEHQVLEHPVLAALREALVAGGSGAAKIEPRTRERGRPTPILIRGAQRSLALDTADGLYGNAFARADLQRILAATTYLDPPTFTNILAMEAPPGGIGPYERSTIEDILVTACVGFAACRSESAPTRIVVHTGGWGTGAYGGDPILMALLQLCAARLAGIDRLVFHTLSGARAFDEASRILDELPWGSVVSTDALVDAVHERDFAWGVSDGN